MKLLTLNNAKTRKGEASGYLTFVLHLAPADLSGYNVCPMASKGCKSACLNTAGMGNYPAVQKARVQKTLWFFQDRDSFMRQLYADILEAEKMAAKENMTVAIRLNATSDVRWEYVQVVIGDTFHPNIMAVFPHIQFYDYTKITNRRDIPDNYHITYSRSESNEVSIIDLLNTGENAAVVFGVKKEGDLPTTWKGFPVVDGDNNDLRFLDRAGVVVGLRAKGKARGKDWGGFVVAP